MKITNKPGTPLTRSEVIAEKSAHLATNLHKTKSALPEAVLTKSAIHLDDDVFGGVAEHLRSTQAEWNPKKARALDSDLGVLMHEGIKRQETLVDASGQLTASPLRGGVARGVLVDTPAKAQAAHQRGHDYVYLLARNTPEDLAAALGASGVIVNAGRKSDLSRIAVALGKPAVRVTWRAELSLGKVIAVDGGRSIGL